MKICRLSTGVIFIIVFLLALGLFNCSDNSNETVANATSEVRAREIAFSKTMEDRDIDAFISFISPEAVFFSGNEPLRGHEAITKAWSKFFIEETAPFLWQPDLTEVLESGSLALSSGPIRNAFGEVVGRFNSIWRKDADGQWRVIFDKGS